MKKRFATLILALIMACSLAIPAGAASTLAEEQNETGPVLVVTNNETGEVRMIEATPESVETRTISDSSEIDVGYTAYVPIPSNSRTIVDGGKTEGGVNISIHVVYTISSNREQIKITRCYGAWTPSSSIYTLSNRVAAVHGGADGKIAKKSPKINSFNINTEWGYHNFVTAGDASPYAWADAIVHVTGMTATHSLNFGFHFPDER